MAMVAERAGVSTMTVSNVINGRQTTAEPTRQLVLEAIRALGYRPNAAAQALASAIQPHIGLLYHNAQNGFVSALLIGALSGASKFRVQLTAQPFERRELSSIGEHIDQMIRDGINALLLPPPLGEVINDSALAQQIGIPMIALAPGDTLSRISSVRIDDVSAAHEMTRHLIAMGHRRIGFIRANGTNLIRHTRHRGYCAALEEAGIPYDPALVVDSALNYETGMTAATMLLTLPRRPSAILSSNDEMAAATISVAHRMGLSVPGDVSVCGFDDDPLAVKIWPELTTMHQPIAQIAERGMAELVQRLRDPGKEAEQPKAIYLPYTLIQRESVGRIEG